MSLDEAHFEKLLSLLHLESQTGRERLASDRQTLALSELEALGHVLLDVVTEEESTGLGGRSMLTMSKETRGPLATRFGNGDVVSVSPRKAQVDDAPIATVVRSNRTSLVLAFDRRPPEWIFEGRLRIDVVSNDLSVERQRAGIRAALEMKTGQAFERREILLSRKPPRFEKRAPFKASQPLNQNQREAVELALSARDFALIHGPPGTGKSTVLSEIAVQGVARGQRVLCTAASNAAVDHLLECCVTQNLRVLRVGHPARVLTHLQQHTLDVKIEGHPDRLLARELFDEAFDLQGYSRKQRTQGRSRARFSNAREASAEARKLFEEAKKLETKAVRHLLESADVICATLSMLSGSLLQHEHFDMVLHDEATQAIEPLSLIAFQKSPVLVLAGDPQQLPPTVLSPAAVKQGLTVSLFERLMQEENDNVRQLLTEQYRMHETQMTFASNEMYHGQLTAHEVCRDRKIDNARLSERAPLIFVDTAGKGFDESKAPGTSSLRNEGEAALLVDYVNTLLAAGTEASAVGIISPYSAQVSLMKQLLQAHESLEVDSIDAFQGREKDVVLVSLVRSNPEQDIGFLKDIRRLNVAFTRARKQLVVFGDSATLSAFPFLNRFIDYAHTVSGYRSAWEWNPTVDGLAFNDLVAVVPAAQPSPLER